ncbi:MAG: VOC family protein [Caulobacteraceae bacterium]|nr:VOC family protein [Caulobacteraceae bacterium]
MTDMRLRQVALVAKDLEPVAAQLAAVFGLKVAFRDPAVGVFGLVNVVMPVGGEFIEIVQPVRPDASAARYLARRGGDAGYMVILQAADALTHRRRLAQMGVRQIAESRHEGYQYTHFHPGDCAGVLTSIDSVDGDAYWREPMSDWPPAGKAWRDTPAGGAMGLAAVDIQSRDPAAAAQRWSSLLGIPVLDGTQLRLARGLVRFVPPIDDDATGVVALDIEVADPAGTLATARDLGLPETEGRVLIGGVWMRPVPR